MRVTVEFFARLRDLAGTRVWTCETPDASTVADVWRLSVAAHGALAVLTDRVAPAVNNEFATMRTSVHDGDQVAFLPPVSGG